MNNSKITIVFPTQALLEEAKGTYPDAHLAVDSAAIDVYVEGAGPSF